MCGFDQFGFIIVRNYQHKLAVKGVSPFFTNLSQLAFLLGESVIGLAVCVSVQLLKFDARRYDSVNLPLMMEVINPKSSNYY